MRFIAREYMGVALISVWALFFAFTAISQEAADSTSGETNTVAVVAGGSTNAESTTATEIQPASSTETPAATTAEEPAAQETATPSSTNETAETPKSESGATETPAVTSETKTEPSETAAETKPPEETVQEQPAETKAATNAPAESATQAETKPTDEAAEKPSEPVKAEGDQAPAAEAAEPAEEKPAVDEAKPAATPESSAAVTATTQAVDQVTVTPATNEAPVEAKPAVETAAPKEAEKPAVKEEAKKEEKKAEPAKEKKKRGWWIFGRKQEAPAEPAKEAAKPAEEKAVKEEVKPAATPESNAVVTATTQAVDQATTTTQAVDQVTVTPATNEAPVEAKPAVETAAPKEAEKPAVKEEAKKEEKKAEPAKEKKKRGWWIFGRKQEAPAEPAEEKAVEKKIETPVKEEIKTGEKAVKKDEATEVLVDKQLQKAEAESGTSAVPATAATTAPSTAVASTVVSQQVAAAEAENKPLTQEEMVAAQEEVRRQAKEIEGLKNLDQGYQAMDRKEYEAALKFFSQALDAMPKRPQTVEIRDRTRVSQADCEYEIAVDAYSKGRIPDAKEALKRALSYSPNHAKTVKFRDRLTRDEMKRLAKEALPVPASKSPEYLGKEKNIEAMLKKGREYMAIEEYDKAKTEFKKVLQAEDRNEDAIASLKAIAIKENKLNTKNMDAVRESMLADISKEWTPQLRTEAVGQGGPLTKEGEGMQMGRRRLLDKLNRLIIPELNFRQANIVDVVNFLVQSSATVDTESAPNDRGVNIILNTKRPGAAGGTTAPAAAPKAEEDLFADTSAQPTESAAASQALSGIPTITLSLKNIALMDAIKYITEVTGLKYRIEESAVIITPADVVYGEVVTRTYAVQPSIQEVIIGGKPEGGAEGEMGLEAATVQRGDVRKFFIDAGVPFPEGTSIVYKPSVSKLIVSNTADNLEKFERILAQLNVVPNQVEIEARFIEIGQSDLEELGMEWLLNDNWEVAQNASASAPVPIAGRERIQVNRNQFTKGLRYENSSAGMISPGLSGTYGSILSISSILTNPELTFILHALEQKDGANLLSAPKVMTKSGQQAEIKVVRELIYPTEFKMTPPEVTAGAAGQSVITKGYVTPESFQTKEVGVMLNVTPVVGPDGYTIDLTMIPQVVELQSWINYGTTIVNTDGSQEQMNMPQPIFHSRQLTTGISIWDGQTVVMGGLITEQQLTTEDKVPFLGDIPLVGYLFRSKTSQSVKRNLLIFVTARLVDPAGVPISQSAKTSAKTEGTGQ